MTEPCASRTARLTMFSEAISSISWRWRPSSPWTAAAISGSACASEAVKNESGAEGLWRLEEGGFIGEYLHRHKPLTRLRSAVCGGQSWSGPLSISQQPGQALAVREQYLCKIWWHTRLGGHPESRPSITASPRPCRGRLYANRYAPPFSTERWNAGRACIRDSQADRFGYAPSFPNTLAISPTKLIWMSAPVSEAPTKNSRPWSAPST